MMTPSEILHEIRQLPFTEQTQIKKTLLEHTDANSLIEERKPKMTDEEFLQYLLAKGVITHIPEGMTDEDDDFEPIEFEGKPLSEMIIRERR